ncbi:LysE family translocator [Alloyangia pacifica]|uniref:Threonine/homoserine/homoserine lactone efflux protein n=1 Tax=Alloyangia pacifica TaxID=311180 RepID=A0A1I6TJY7_9RHOB|nr:LysE family transporter [Alloyangia pacifica]SDH15771.1 Threonine/homoserine/homoserine lactone efflux protein [Alloyangia pacifica]SFS89461.1 Threonine/homoserine/homoserine lactone efflux protein [Alloyangia pacifica]
MPLDLWLTFVAASVALLLIPGPTVLLVLSYALSKGRSVALASAAGVALGDFTAMSLSLAGLGALVLASATAFTVLKWIGALYLVWMGVKLLRSAPGSGLSMPRAEVTPRGVFGHAAAVTALNPKSIAFFIAFVPQFVDTGAPLLPQFALLVATFVTLAALNVLAYALAADRLRVLIGRPSVLAWLTRAGGAALIAMGALTATLRRAA